jgi:C4-dicarboxylate-binding protein DctP
MSENKFNLVHFMVFLTIISFFWLMGGSPVLSKTINIKMGNVDTPVELTLDKTNGEYASTDIKCKAFKKIIEESSHGKIKVKVFPAGQLGGEREMLEMTKMGSLQMNGCSAAALATFVPEVMALQIPYIFSDENVGLRVMKGPIGQEMNELIAKKMGMRIFDWAFEGYYNIGNIKRPIRVPSDLKGMKIRVAESPNLMEIIKAAGGVATPIPFTEVYTALQQGVVDGVMTGIGLHYTIKTHELIKYFDFANMWFGWSPIGINEEFYRSLSAEDQELIKEAALKAMATYQGMVFWGRDLWVELFRERGIEVYFQTAAEKEEWVETVRPPLEKWTRKEIGSEWVDKIMKASEEAEKELYGP